MVYMVRWHTKWLIERYEMIKIYLQSIDSVANLVKLNCSDGATTFLITK